MKLSTQLTPDQSLDDWEDYNNALRICAEIAAHEGRNVLAIDLDEQQNLAGMLRLTGNSFPSIEVRDSLREEYAQEDFDLFI